MEDVLIIGAGTAGLSAAIYTARAGLKTLVCGIVKRSNAYRAHAFENYFGIPSVTGPEFMNTAVSQAERFGAKIISREITEIKMTADKTFTARDSELETYNAKFIIIASGLGFKPSGIKKEKDFLGRGVSFCATCDGYFFKGKKIVVIGEGNFAGEEALELLAHTSQVTVLSHGKEFTMGERMEKTLRERGAILLKTVRVSNFEGGKDIKATLAGLSLADGKHIECEGAFIALGTAGSADFAMQLGLEYEKAYIKIDSRTGKTNVPGVFAAGDCTGGNAQAAKSTGEGCNAAIGVIKSLRGVSAYVDY